MASEPPELNVVTGAFGYTGRYIARRLLPMGEQVATLTGHPERPNPFGGQVRVARFRFDDEGELARSLEGATTLYNTYWVRFPRGEVTFDKAVENTLVLIRAARQAGVRRLVHISITNASVDSPLPYFRGKGVLERAIAGAGLSYAIIRPTVVFGPGDVLINNIAWFLRKFPVFAVFGAGSYPIQPVHVEDVAELAVSAAQAEGNVALDAVGPETYTFDEMVRLIAETVGSRARLAHLPPRLAHLLTRVAGCLVRDVVLTSDEVAGLMAGLLVSQDSPTGSTRLSDWLGQNAGVVGTGYASELRRHYRPS